MRTRKPTEVPASLKTINVKALLRKRGIYTEQKINHDMKEAALPVAKKMVKARRTPKQKSEPQRHSQFTNEQVLGYWEKQIHIVDVIEKRFENKVEQFIGKMVDGFLAGLDTELAETKKMVAKDYFSDNQDDLRAQAQLDFVPLLTDQAVLAGREALDLINSKEVYSPYELREEIAKNVARFTQSMLDTDRQTLIDIVTEGIQQGKSVPEIRGAISTSFEDITKSQAQRITRTEVLRVSNQAAIDAWDQSGVVEGKQWLTAGAVDKCAAYEGKIVSLKSEFYKGGNEFEDGDPPLHPNCRCVVLPVLLQS